MIKIAVVDLSAESRTGLMEECTSFLRLDSRDINLIPRISIKPFSLQELKFHAAPDICIIGPELAGAGLAEIPGVKKTIPGSSILVRIPGERASLSLIDDLARAGADDVISGDISPTDFLHKIILLSRRVAKTSNGKLLVVEGGKGGVGVTSVAAALAESLYEAGKSVALLDLDVETQDLSRFLQVRPFINENLRLLFDAHRPVTEEAVAECLVPVWQGSEGFDAMPPVADMDETMESSSLHVRTMLSILEVLDARYDCVVVDAACVRGELRKMFYRAADKLIFVINNDPATLYASSEKLVRIRGQLSSAAQLLVLENGSSRHGLNPKLLRAEFSRASKLEESCWASDGLPFCRQGMCWPGSGSTLFSQARSQLAKATQSLLEDLGLVEKKSRFKLLNFFSANLSAAQEGRAPLSLPEPAKQKALGSATNNLLALPGSASFEAARKKSAQPFFKKSKATPGLKLADNSPKKEIFSQRVIAQKDESIKEAAVLVAVPNKSVEEDELVAELLVSAPNIGN